MSRQKSASTRGAKTPAARPAARAAGARGVYVQAPKSDIFVVLLSISLGAIILGCLLLLLVWKQYDFSTQVTALFGSPHAGSVPQVLGDLNRIPVLLS